MQTVVTMKCQSARLQVKVSHELCIELLVSRRLMLTFIRAGEGVKRVNITAPLAPYFCMLLCLTSFFSFLIIGPVRKVSLPSQANDLLSSKHFYCKEVTSENSLVLTWSGLNFLEGKMVSFLLFYGSFRTISPSRNSGCYISHLIS